MRVSQMITSSALALAMSVSTIGAAGAMPMGTTGQAVAKTAQTSIVDVQQRRRRGDPDRRGFHRRNGKAFMNGHRGRHRRGGPGWRRHNGWWFPPAAFALGAIIGGAVDNDRPRARRGNLPRRHVRWCDRQYKTYRLRDNTFQPYEGPRRACASPYWP